MCNWNQNESYNLLHAHHHSDYWGLNFFVFRVFESGIPIFTDTSPSQTITRISLDLTSGHSPALEVFFSEKFSGPALSSLPPSEFSQASASTHWHLAGLQQNLAPQITACNKMLGNIPFPGMKSCLMHTILCPSNKALLEEVSWFEWEAEVTQHISMQGASVSNTISHWEGFTMQSSW